MNGQGRRMFLSDLLKIAGATVLSYVPGSLFHATKLFAAEQAGKPHSTLKRLPASRPGETLESVLAKTNNQNVYQVLQQSSLSQEEKLAVAAVREVDPNVVKGFLARGEIYQEAGTGYGCGNGCGMDCGNNCGHGCHHTIYRGDQFVFNRQGALKINFNAFNKAKFRSALSQAANLQGKMC